MLRFRKDSDHHHICLPSVIVSYTLVLTYFPLVLHTAKPFLSKPKITGSHLTSASRQVVECTVRGRPLPQLSWRVNGEKFKIDADALLVEETTDVTMLITRLRISVKNPLLFGKNVEIWCIAANSSVKKYQKTSKSDSVHLNRGNFVATLYNVCVKVFWF